MNTISLIYETHNEDDKGFHAYHACVIILTTTMCSRHLQHIHKNCSRIVVRLYYKYWLYIGTCMYCLLIIGFKYLDNEYNTYTMYYKVCR